MHGSWTRRRISDSVTGRGYGDGMELHQIVGLFAIQVALGPAAYAASNLAGRVFRAVAHRVLTAGWPVAPSSNARGPVIARDLGIVATWALFNTAFVLLAGVV